MRSMTPPVRDSGTDDLNGSGEGIPSLKTTPGLPLSVVLGCVVGLLMLGLAQPQLRDVDLYWHVLAGKELASGVPASQVGMDWSFAPDPLPWTSTQWIAELFLYWLQLLGGWAALAAFRVVTAFLALAVLALTTLRNRPAVTAGPPFLVAAGAAWLWSEERPQQVTLIGAAVLGGVLIAGLQRGSLPRWWVALPLTVIWANVHGGWVLVPAVLALIGIGRIVDHGTRDRPARHASVLALAALAMGAVGPGGMSSITAVFRFSNAATGLIEEWDPTVPFSVSGSLTIAMLVLIALGWVRERARVPKSEVLALLILLIFSWTAWRNVPPALLIMAPLVADRLGHAFPEVGDRPEPRWSARLGIVVAVSLTLLALITLPGRDHLPRDAYPVGLAAAIAGLAGQQRVLNDYAVAGLVLALSPGARVGIDGRTDRYGSEYIQRYLDTVRMKGDWRKSLADLDPTSALIEDDSPLAEYLTWKGWRVVGRESGYVLLVDPSKGPG